MSSSVPDTPSFEEYKRLSALQALRILDTPPEARFDRLTDAAATAFDVPIALVSLVDEKRQWFKSHHGIDVSETDRAHSFCAHAIRQEGTFTVRDATCDPRFAANPLVTGDPQIRFYAGEALTTLDGVKLGTLCIIDRKPRELTDDQKLALRALAAQVSDELSANRVELRGYRLLEVIGRGGMGVVYKARDTRLGRVVAVKVILREHATNQEFLERFRREARALASVSHANVLTVHDLGEDHGVVYMVFEYVPGGTLADTLIKTGPLPVREALRVGAEVASGLGAIHAVGLVHRDLKPGNVLFDAERRAKLADFGLARNVAKIAFQASSATVHSQRPLTQVGEIVGTPQYMSPEQALGDENLDGRSDLYSLGATLFAALTGQAPFHGSGYELLNQVIRAKPPKPSDVIDGIPKGVDKLVGALLEKEREKRPESALDVAEELERLRRSRRKS